MPWFKANWLSLICQISDSQLTLNQGTLYPALLKLDAVGMDCREVGRVESGRRVKVYSLTKAGRKQLEQQESRWHRTTGIIDRFFKIPKEA